MSISRSTTSLCRLVIPSDRGGTKVNCSRVYVSLDGIAGSSVAGLKSTFLNGDGLRSTSLDNFYSVSAVCDLFSCYADLGYICFSALYGIKGNRLGACRALSAYGGLRCLILSGIGISFIMSGIGSTRHNVPTKAGVLIPETTLSTCGTSDR